MRDKQSATLEGRRRERKKKQETKRSVDTCNLPESKGGERFKQNGMTKTVKCRREMEQGNNLKAGTGFDTKEAFVILEQFQGEMEAKSDCRCLAEEEMELTTLNYAFKGWD